MKMIVNKLERRIRGAIVRIARPYWFYPWMYISTWRTLFPGHNKKDKNEIYFAAMPNPGAGIGHQMANWIAGYWFAKQFNVNFAHIPFSSQEWEWFLGFGRDEISIDELLSQGYKIRRIPLFNENEPIEVERIRRCVAAYAGKKVILLCEQDQTYADQFGVIEDIQRKFDAAPARTNDRLVYRPGATHVAVHVRRGDIVQGAQNGDAGMLQRWQDMGYFEKVTETVLQSMGQEKPVHLHIFSQGKREEFSGFERFEGVQFHLDMGARDSFLHMVKADILITSKSSFSYKPGLLCKGIRVCPQNFWHNYPDDKSWILVDDEGVLITRGEYE